jgi:FtsH-binding integral membrane protein
MILFSFFIIVNTQEVLYTDIEPLDAACSLYLDILNMFIALLNILTSFSKD